LDERSARSVSKRRRSSSSANGLAFFRFMDSSFHQAERCFADHWEIFCRLCLAHGCKPIAANHTTQQANALYTLQRLRSGVCRGVRESVS
jgi:hypothetical protein